MKLSVAIPCWSMNGAGHDMLEYNFQILKQQTFKEFEVVVTDHSEDFEIESLCKVWKYLLNITYIRNENFRGYPAHNTNLGIKNCSGDYIKLLCQDDFLFGNDALEKIYKNISEKDSDWMFMSYWHSNDRKNLYRHYTPYYNTNIAFVNTFGTPSALTIKNKDVPEFDINLKSMYDCEFYYQMIMKYGMPKIVNDATMINYLHGNQTTNSLINNEVLRKEEEYVRSKHCLN